MITKNIVNSVMTEPTAVIAYWSVGGLSKFEVKPGGGVTAGILDNGTPVGISNGIVECEGQRRSDSVLQRRFLSSVQSSVTLGGKRGYLECLDPCFDR